MVIIVCVVGPVSIYITSFGYCSAGVVIGAMVVLVTYLLLGVVTTVIITGVTVYYWIGYWCCY
jgi:hypothetical protein